MLQDQLFLALIRSKNEAADEVLVEALRLGNESERSRVLDALLDRRSSKGLAGVVALFEKLPEALQQRVLANIKLFHTALREAGRSETAETRAAALRLIARSHQGRLAYVLSENLHDANEVVSRSAADAMVALARWVATESRALQRGPVEMPPEAPAPTHTPEQIHQLLMEQRPEIEASVARALDVHRGRHGQDLLRAATLLIDSPASRAFQILATPKHGGQTTMVRRLQQPPTGDNVDAFLLGASHGHLRSQFASAFAHVADAAALDALLRKTHWLKDKGLSICMHTVGRGVWWNDADLQRDLERRRPEDGVRIAEWISLSGSHDSLQDERLEKIRSAVSASFGARLRVFRVACRRRNGAPITLLKTFLGDSDERLVRMAAREIIRRRPQDFENMLLQLMTNTPASVRRVVGRAIGQVGFEHFWNKFDRLPKPTRRQAGKAMMKLLPDAPERLRRRLTGGPVEQRLKGLAMVHELGLAEQLYETVLKLCQDADARVRSKAVLVAGAVPSVTPDLLVERLLKDGDSRVRANAIEVLEAKADTRFVPVLMERARQSTNRERANAIKALFSMRVNTVSSQLFTMLKDNRPEHRISAMWALRQIGWWQLLSEVGRLAKEDQHIRVRRYALNLLKGVADMAATASAAKAG